MVWGRVSGCVYLVGYLGGGGGRMGCLCRVMLEGFGIGGWGGWLGLWGVGGSGWLGDGFWVVFMGMYWVFGGCVGILCMV